MAVDFVAYALSVIAAGGGGGTVAYGIFKTYGAKWLDSRFARQLEKVRQDHAREIEHLRYRIAHLLDRSTKLNQREFEVLPIVWERVDEAHYATSSMIAVAKFGGIDLGLMGDEQLEAFFEKSTLEEYHKKEIRSRGRFDRTSYYSEIERWQELHRASVAVSELHKTLSKNSIYLHPDVFIRINQFAETVGSVVHMWKLDRQIRDAGAPPVKPDPNDDPIGAYRKNGQKDFDELRSFIQDRYWQAPDLAEDAS